MRTTVLTCDMCGKQIDKSTLSIAMFPYQNLLEFCDDCAKVMKTAIETAMKGGSKCETES